jgi:hypothetical protein
LNRSIRREIPLKDQVFGKKYPTTPQASIERTKRPA